MTAILKEDPPEITTTGKPIAPALERIVRRCLGRSRYRGFSPRAIWHSIWKDSWARRYGGQCDCGGDSD